MKWIAPATRAVAFGAAFALTAVSADAQPSRWALEWPNTDFERSSVDFNDILDGGPPRDGIPAISDPARPSPCRVGCTAIGPSSKASDFPTKTGQNRTAPASTPPASRATWQSSATGATPSRSR